jgi:hypothetical protein
MKTQLVEFIKSKIADVEKAIRCREDSERCFRSGTEASWKAAAAMNGAKPMTKAQRLDSAEREYRILIKLRRELEMFNAVLNELSPAAKSNQGEG